MKTTIERFALDFQYNSFSRLLDSYGWVLRSTHQNYAVWHLSSPRTQIVVPNASDLLDFSEHFSVMIERLARTYERSVEELFAEYTGIRRNRVKLRIVGKELEGGVIPFSQALTLMESTREMLIASYLATSSKKKNYLGSRPDNITEHLEKIEMGQTEVGSYIINVFMPVDSEQEEIVPDVPLATKAFRQLEEAAESLKIEIENYKVSDEIEVFDKLVERGVSSNFCFAVNQIGNDGKNDVDIRLEYYSRLDEEPIIKNIFFDKTEIEIVRKVGEYYKQDLTEPGYKLIGFVVDLHRDKDEVEGDITVLATIDKKRRHVRLHLNYLDYLTAIRAHETTTRVQIVGTLVNHVNRTSMISISEVSLYQSASSDSNELF